MGKINTTLVPKAHSQNIVQHYRLSPSLRALFLSSWIQLANSGERTGFSYKNSSTTNVTRNDLLVLPACCLQCAMELSHVPPQQSRSSEINRSSYLGRVRLRIRQFREISDTRYWRRQQRVKDAAAPQRPWVNEFLSSWRLL